MDTEGARQRWMKLGEYLWMLKAFSSNRSKVPEELNLTAFLVEGFQTPALAPLRRLAQALVVDAAAWRLLCLCLGPAEISACLHQNLFLLHNVSAPKGCVLSLLLDQVRGSRTTFYVEKGVRLATQLSLGSNDTRCCLTVRLR